MPAPNLPTMTELTIRIEQADVASGFRSGTHALDDYFSRHALGNDRDGVSTAYVLRRADGDPQEWPRVIGYYTLSMAEVASPLAAAVLGRKLPRYPLPVALIGRLAVHRQVQGRRFGEKLLLDALRRVAAAASGLGCLGVIVDAKDEGAARFYARYGFVALQELERWPHRYFLGMNAIHGAFADDEISQLRQGRSGPL